MNRDESKKMNPSPLLFHYTRNCDGIREIYIEDSE